MRLCWLLAILVLLTLALCCTAVAGPRHEFGDPDIVDTMRPKNGSSINESRDATSWLPTIEFWVLGQVWRQQECRRAELQMVERLRSAERPLEVRK
jgi:hypothetical protein